MDQEHYEFLKDCLRQFNYPNVHGMDDLEIADVFSTTNRQFLITWFLKELDDDYSEIVKDMSKNELANIIHCHGFCSKSEKDAFMCGECDVERQFVILHKMFKFLKSVEDGRKTEDCPKSVTLEEIEDCRGAFTNLFPMYGPKQTLSVSERERKIAEYRREIEDLKLQMDSTLTDELEDDSIDLSVQQQLISIKQSFDTNFANFKKQVFELLENRNKMESKKIAFDGNFTGVLEACSKDTELILQFTKSMNLIKGFKDNSTAIDDVDPNSNLKKMMREIADLCTKVSLLKEESSLE